ncbi:MAG: hypothetical protein M3O82_05515 [Verrucomicrobiota bacterium]|nr:hypothetical protein [Verrucomicrobiota bacterium]
MRTTFLWALIGFCAFGLLVFVWFRVGPRAQNVEQKRAAARMEKLAALQTENEKHKTYAWGDKAKGVVHVPVDRAVELVIADLHKKIVHASGAKVEVPYPYGLSQPVAAAASPAPGGSPVPAGSPAAGGSPAPAGSPGASPASPKAMASPASKAAVSPTPGATAAPTKNP